MYDDPQQFPLDLIVKRTVAYIRLKEDNHALAQVGLQFLAETEDASTVSDLFLEVGKAYEHIRKFEVAIAYFNKVAMFMDKVAFFFFFFLVSLQLIPFAARTTATSTRFTSTWPSVIWERTTFPRPRCTTTR